MGSGGSKGAAEEAPDGLTADEALRRLSAGDHAGLEHLDVDRIPAFAGAEGADRLARALRGNRSLLSISCGRLQIDLSAIEPVAAAIRAHPTLQRVALHGNELGAEGAAVAASLLCEGSCPSLEDLNLEDNSLGADGCCIVARALAEHAAACPLTALNLCDNCVRDDGAEALASALSKPGIRLKSLRLDGFNSINDRGVAALAKALHSNISLRLLDLSGQNIYPAGARALASMLGVNRSLETLKLHQNALEDEGVVALVDALREHADTVALTALDVGHNQWGGDEAVRAVCAMLGATRTLRSLEVEQSGLGDSGTATLAATLRTQRTLRHLNLSGCFVGDLGAKALARALAHNRTLEHLDLSRNGVDDEGCSALASALRGESITGCSSDGEEEGDGVDATGERWRNMTLATLDLRENAAEDPDVFDGVDCRVTFCAGGRCVWDDGDD